jgi:hypothetical protein
MILARPHTRAELLARVREAGFSAAPPKVRNAAAAVALGEHRARRWRGHRYIVPPLPFHPGIVLLGCREIMRDEQAPERARRDAVHRARAVAHGCLRVRRFLRRGLAAPRRNPFRRMSPDQLCAVIDDLLHVPDETPFLPAKGEQTVDLIDGLMEYLRGGYPITPEGLPVSWAHYQYGLRHAARQRARDELRAAQAARMAWVNKDAFDRYVADLQAPEGLDG